VIADDGLGVIDLEVQRRQTTGEGLPSMDHATGEDASGISRPPLSAKRHDLDGRADPR